MVCSLALGGTYLLVTPTTYRAESKLLVRQSALSFDPNEPDARNHREFLATQAEIIRSSVIINAALFGADLDEAATSSAQTAGVLKALAVAPLAHTDVLTVSLDSDDPTIVVEQLTAILSEYKAFVNRNEKDSSSKSLLALTNREQQLREDLRKLQEEQSKLRNDGPVVGQGRDSITIDMAQLKELAARIAELRRLQAEVKGRLDGLTAPVAAPIGQTTAGQERDLGIWEEVAEVQRELRAARVRAKGLSSSIGPEHRERIAADQLVVAMELALKQQSESVIERLHEQLRIYEQSEHDLAALYETERQKIKSLDQHLLRESQLNAEIERLERTHESIVANITNLRVAEGALSEGGTTVRIQILQAPAEVGAPVWPQPAPLLALCALMGLIGGSGLVAYSASEPQSNSTEQMT